MAIQETSIEALREVQKDLGSRQRSVYNMLKRIGPASNKMIARALGWEINSITPRIFELRDMKLVGYTYTDRCKITGRKSLFWRCVK